MMPDIHVIIAVCAVPWFYTACRITSHFAYNSSYKPDIDDFIWYFMGAMILALFWPIIAVYLLFKRQVNYVCANYLFISPAKKAERKLEKASARKERKKLKRELKDSKVRVAHLEATNRELERQLGIGVDDAL